MAETFISVDVETSGGIPGVHDLLSLGACLVESPDVAIRLDIQPLHGNIEPEALRVNGLDMETQAAVGLPLPRAMAAFGTWVSDTVPKADTAVFVALNAPFDWGFVNRAFNDAQLGNPFHFVPLDLKALYMGSTGCSWDDTRSSRMHAALGPSLAPDHADPLADARYQAELFRLIRSLGVAGGLRPTAA